MIGEITVIWLGTIALGSVLGGIAVSVRRYRQNDGSLVGLIMYGFGLLFWILFTLHSTNYARALGSGTQTTVATPSFMALGVIGVIVSILLLFDGALRAFRSPSRATTGATQDLP